MQYVKKEFPSSFSWGAATSSFQIEGAAREDGKGESIWDRFCETPGNILTGERGDSAADSYHRFEDDLAIMKALNLNAYRFSISWPRIFPQGKGKIEEKGIAFYDRIVDQLLDNHIDPFVTLYHWDLPQALQDEGGWYSRDTVQHFLDYIQAMTQRLGDRVKYWATFNEPWVVAFVGNLEGRHAPGISDVKTAVQVSHHLLLAHGMALPLIRQNSPGCKAGIVLNLSPVYPATDSDEDREAASLNHATLNAWFLDPLHGRGYPREALDYYAENGPEIKPGEMEVIARTNDFLGVNYYFRTISHQETLSKPLLLNYLKSNTLTSIEWEVNPEGLFDLLVWLKETYPVREIRITENGAAYEDVKADDGSVYDPQRQAYLKEHLTAIWHALKMGAPVTGYYGWSLIDNFEWAYGTSKRFGLAYTDYKTQERTLKESGKWYSLAARLNAIP